MSNQERIDALERKIIELEAKIFLLNNRTQYPFPIVYPTYPAPNYPMPYWYVTSGTGATITVT
jgi:hypothetical protein